MTKVDSSNKMTTNPDCNNAKLWGPCADCNCWFCQGQPHSEKCLVIYDEEDMKELKT